MDIATIVGIVLGLVVVIGAIAVGAGKELFINIPSLAITMGGMLCATLIHFSLPQFLGIFSIIKKTIATKVPSQSELIQKMVNYAAINRRDGALALEQEISKIDDLFFVKGLQMLVDGQDGENVRELMSLEIQYLRERHSTGKKMLEFMGAAAPAFGMIGTLIGLDYHFLWCFCRQSDFYSVGGQTRDLFQSRDNGDGNDYRRYLCHRTR